MERWHYLPQNIDRGQRTMEAAGETIPLGTIEPSEEVRNVNMAQNSNVMHLHSGKMAPSTMFLANDAGTLEQLLA